MAWKLTVNGADKTDQVLRSANPTVSERLNERSMAMVKFNEDPITLDQFVDEFVMYDVDGVTPVFGGILTMPATEDIGERGSLKHFTAAELTDFMWYTDNAYWEKEYTAPVTLEQVMDDLVAEVLGVYGIAVDAAQDTGPTLDPFTVDGKVSDFLRTLAGRCSPTRVIKMSPLKKLRIMVPGTSAAPFNVTDANPHCLSFEWSGTQFVPANYVTLICGPTGEGLPTQHWTGDGVTTAFEVDIQAVVGGWTQGYVLEVGIGARVDYTWSETTGRGTVTFSGPPPGVGVVLEFIYTAIYPFRVTSPAVKPATPIEYRDARPDELLLAPAQATADGLLAKLNQKPRQATMVTLESGLERGQSITVTLTSRSVSAATFIVAQIDKEFTEFEDSGVRLWHYTALLTETTEYQGSYLDQARAMFGNSGGVSSVAGGGSTPVTVISGPVFLGGIDTARIPMAATPVYSLLLNWLPFTPPTDMTVEVTAWIWNAQNGAIQGKVEIAEFIAPSTFIQVAESGWTASATRIGGETSFLALLEAGKIYVARAKSDTASTGISAMAQLVQL